MSKLSRCLLAILALMLVFTYSFPAGTVYADGEGSEEIVFSGTCGDNLTWELDGEGVLLITGIGEMDNYEEEASPWHSSRLSVKMINITEGVTSIGDYAFGGFDNLSIVAIPSGITKIGTGAFSGCTSLTKIDIPESVTVIGIDAFSGSGLENVTIPGGVKTMQAGLFRGCGSLSCVSIKEGVTSIEQDAFSRCSNLTSITIPNSVTTIGSGAFSGCKMLKYISLPTGITTIEENLFAYCFELEEISIPTEVQIIEDYAFGGCRSLTNVIIPDGVTTIGNGVFYDCSSLISVTIPSSVISLGDGLFDYKDPVTVVYTPQDSYTALNPPENCEVRYTSGICGENLAWKLNGEGVLTITGIGEMANYEKGKSPWYSINSQIIGVEIADGVTNIGNNAFYWSQNITYITIPDSVNNIGECAFYNCSSLATITIPESVTSIEKHTFYNCSRLATITIPESVTSIKECAFLYCTNLKSVTIPKGVTNIGRSAFGSCSSIESMIVSEDNPQYDSRNNCNAIIETETNKLIMGCNNSFIPGGVQIIGDYAFEGCDGLSDIIIPEGVTSIGSSAFEYCSSLTSIAVPGSVTGIGNYAFCNCSSLESVEFLEGLSNIGYGAFYGCSSLANVVVPDGVTSIYGLAFYNCDSLVSVTIPGSVVSLGDNLFSEKDPLTIVYTPRGSYTALNPPDNCEIRYIDQGVITSGTCGDNLTWELSCDGVLTISGTGEMTDFDIYSPWYSYRSSINSVVITDGVTSIGNDAFRECSILTEITISESVTSIGERSFIGCSSLTSITVPEGVTSIKEGVFCGCSNLTCFNIPESVKSIELWAFRDCNSLTSIIIPGGVTNINKYAFGGNSLESIIVSEDNQIYDSRENCNAIIETETNKVIRGCNNSFIPDGIQVIGVGAFSGCDGLTSIVIPNGVASIEDAAFSGCSNLTSIAIPASVVNIGSGAFQLCSGLTSIKIPEGLTSIEPCLFLGCSSLTDIIIPEGVTSIGGSAFGDCSSLVSVTIPGSVVSLGDYLFSEKDPLTIVYTPRGSYTALNPPDNCEIRFIEAEIIASGTCGDNLTWELDDKGVLTISGTGEMTNYEVGVQPWYNPWRPSIKRVVIMEGVTSIGDYAFYECKNLARITIPESVTTIGQYAFAWCGSLTRITIPDNVTCIEKYAFVECRSLTSITLPFIGRSKSEENYLSYIFGGSSYIDNGSSWVPSSLKEVIIAGEITGIGDSAFHDCINLTSITIPESVTSIGDSAFEDCMSLTSIMIPSSVTSFGNSAFKGCNSLTSITIPLSVTNISNSAFEDCLSLTNITIPESVTSLGDSAFKGCRSLTNITIPESVTTIGQYAFAWCGSLTRITIPDNVTCIGDYAFSRCYGLISLLIPESVDNIGDDAFQECSSLEYLFVVKETFADNWLQRYGYANKMKYVIHIDEHYYTESIKTEAACESNGIKEMCCVVCGDYYTEIIPAKGHTFGEWVVVDAPSCTDQGSEQRTCLVCGATESQNLDPNGHTWDDEYTVDQEPGCTTDGSKSRHCLFCEQRTDVEVIPALGHDWDTENVVFNWSEDLSSAEATFTCKRDHSHVETLQAAVTSETAAGIITYTATVVFEDATYTDTKTVDAHDIIRLFGSNRYATAIAAADHLKEKKGVETFDTIVIASGDGFPDALSASYLAYKKDGPILLYGKTVIGMVTDYVNDNLSPGGTVYIVGGEGVIPLEVEKLINGKVVRLAGANRYATNIAVLNEAGVEGEDLLVASGKGFADALSASAAKRPIFLVGNTLDKSQKDYLDKKASSMSGDIYIIGGQGAVSYDVEGALKGYGTVKRLSGSDRYKTSMAVADEFFKGNVGTVVIANGNNFPDGLSGGPIAVTYDAPLILVVDKISGHAEDYFKAKAAYRLIIMGGTGVIADETADRIFGGTE